MSASEVTSTVQRPTQVHIQAFTPSTSIWDRWIQRLQGAFTIMRIQDKDKVPHLLHYVGEEAFNNLCDHFGADDPYTKAYDVLVNKLKELYAPASLEIAENFKFNCRKQKAGEEIQVFANEITKFSLTCNFGDFQKTILRNQFVFGIESKRVQSRLLETKDLTYKAVQTALAMELVEKEAK